MTIWTLDFSVVIFIFYHSESKIFFLFNDFFFLFLFFFFWLIEATIANFLIWIIGNSSILISSIATILKALIVLILIKSKLSCSFFDIVYQVFLFSFIQIVSIIRIRNTEITNANFTFIQFQNHLMTKKSESSIAMSATIFTTILVFYLFFSLLSFFFYDSQTKITFLG